ncbi:MAG: hypothetical protein N2380_06500 [bacterium]|nr:hypothetical protein [bacterium]
MKRWVVGIAFILILATNTFLYANSPVRLKGDQITISQELVVAIGNIYVEYKDITLKANYVELDPKTWVLTAKGNVSITQEKNAITGETLTLFLKEDKYKLDNVKGELTDRSVKGFIYIKGDSLEKGQQGSIRGEGVSFTTCNLETPHYYIKARELIIYPQERLYATDVSFYVGNTRIFSLAYYNLLFEYPDRQPFIPEIGSSTDKGYYIKTFYSHYQSRNLYGYATLELAEKTGIGLGLTEFYNIKNVGPGSFNIYVLPTIEEIKADIGLTQEAKIGDIRLNGAIARENVLYDRWEYRISASSKGYSLSHQGLENKTSNVSSYNTNIEASEKIGEVNTSLSLSNRYYESGGVPIESNDYRLTATTKIGDVNTSISLRDRFYKKANIPAEVGEYRITANTKIQNMNIKGEVFTISYPDIASLSQFGYSRILTKVPELSIGSSIPISPDISVNGELNIGNYIELPTNIQGYAIKGNIQAIPKTIKVLDGDLESSLRINGSYYLPESYIAGLGINARWTKDILQNLRLNLSYEYNEGWGNSLINILSELPALPSNAISGSLISKGDDYSITISSKYDILNSTLNPIVINSSWQRGEENKVSLNLSINPYYLGDITAVSTISWRIDPKWKIDMSWKLYAQNLQFQEIRINYDLHCWEMNLRYNYTTQTTSISFSLKALPGMGTIGLPEF